MTPPVLSKPCTPALAAAVPAPPPVSAPVFWQFVAQRYLLQDLAARLGSVLLGTLAYQLSGRLDLLTVAAILGDNLAFYGVALMRERHGGRNLGGWRSLIRRIVREFGWAEVLDTFLIQPICLVLTFYCTGSPLFTVVAGDLAADVLFYAMAGRRAWGHPGRTY